MKIYVFLTALLCISSIAVSQDNNDSRWNNPSSVVMAYGDYVPLPFVPYENPVTQPWTVSTAQGNFLVFPNIRVLPTSNQQTEVPLVISRNTPTFMFGSSNRTSGSDINSGSYITTNGGVTWFGQDFINNGNTNNQRGDPGPAIGKDNRVIFTHLSSNTNFGGVTGMAGEYSTNFGMNFSPSFQIHSSSSDDKNLACGDDVPTSPFYGNFYMTFCNLSSPNTSHVARTTDGGVTWQPSVSWPAPSGSGVQGHDIVTRPNGDVIAIYAVRNTFSPFTETGLGVGRSTNGGVSFTSIQPAYTVNGTRSTSFNGWGIRTNGFPRIACDKSGGARNGWLYVVTDEWNLAPAGSDADVVLHRSTDGGITWSAGVRVNQDPLNNGKVQFFPCVCVDENGGVNVAYYDNRAFPSVGDSCSVYISRSIDGGNTWVDAEVADHHFRPKPTPGLGGGYMGDYIGVAAGNGKVWAFWTDDKWAFPTFQAMAGYITSGPPPANDVAVGPFLSFPSLFLINSNYTIRARVQNIGTNGQTSLPIRFSINGVIQTTNTIPSLPAGAVDSSSFSWTTPGSAGTFVLRIFSGAAVDQNRLNDTVTATVNVLTALPPLCEQFTSSTFPPTDWSLTGSASLWSRHTVSANGLGVGSAKADFYNVSTGSQQLNTLTFTPYSSANLIFFDAYRTYINENDQLQILASTNGGSTYTSVVTLNGGISGELVTAPPSTTAFTPTASQWKKQTIPLPANTNKIRFNAITAYGNNLYIDSICVQSTVEVTQNGGIIPSVYSLSQNYPNPFNPVTNIKFGLPNAGFTKLEVYDILGRVIKTLVNENKPAGSYTVDFDATNISSGVYFYKIESGGFTDIKKMVVVK